MSFQFILNYCFYYQSPEIAWFILILRDLGRKGSLSECTTVESVRLQTVMILLTLVPLKPSEGGRKCSVPEPIPPLTLHEDPDGTSQGALDKQLERPTPKKELCSHCREKTFAVRRRFIVRIGDHVSNLSPPEVQSPFCAFCCKCMHHH